ncbi:MAG: sugar ABC transporter ATP-binding protein [Candidatus Solibacter sp.]
MSLLAARRISKQFPGTLALDSVDFAVRAGQVNALIGENGAGKSTLMRILAGIDQPTSGSLEMDGREIVLTSPRGASSHGIAMIHQELNLLPNLTVAENIFLGCERTRRGVIDRNVQERVTAELMLRLQQPIKPRTLVGSLPIGQQQIVEIAKAIAPKSTAQAVRVLIMDEPTSALSAAEIAALFRTIRDLKARGIGIVYISHRLEELLTIGDTVTVLRDGRAVAESPAATVGVGWLVEQMTGRAAAPSTYYDASSRRTAVLEVATPEAAFRVAAGEIVGIYGLMGAGRTELLETLIGLRATTGSILLDGAPVERLSIWDRIRRGLVLAPEDRQRAAILDNLSVGENITITDLAAKQNGFYVSPSRQRARAEQAIREMQIRAPGPDAPITALSGGNQQKVVLSRAMLTEPKVLLLDEPTRGVDVGARAEIFEIIRRMAAGGVAVVFSSSEIHEVLTLATRVLVMAGSRLTGEFATAEATPEALVAASAPTAARRIA